MVIEFGWDPSSREAMPKDDPVNAPGKLRVAVIVSPPAGNPSKVKESHIAADDNAGLRISGEDPGREIGGRRQRK